MRRAIWILLALALNGVPVGAQVMKCVNNATKAVTYTDGACAPGTTSTLTMREQTAEEIQTERAQAQQALQQKYQRQQYEAATQPQYAPVQQSGPAISPYECDLARRNLDTANSARTVKSNTEGLRAEMNMKCFGTGRAGKIEQARAGAPRVIINNPPPVHSPPATMTHCAGAYCYDNQGSTHFMPRR
jgi:hypothetical protein